MVVGRNLRGQGFAQLVGGQVVRFSKHIFVLKQDLGPGQSLDHVPVLIQGAGAAIADRGVEVDVGLKITICLAFFPSNGYSWVLIRFTK